MILKRRSAAEVYLDYNCAENFYDLNKTTNLVAKNLVVEINGQLQVSSGSGDRAFMTRLFEIYPDYRREIRRIVAAGNEATVLWKMVGTPTPSNSQAPILDVQGVSIVTANGSVLTHACLFVDSDIWNRVLKNMTQKLQE